MSVDYCPSVPETNSGPLRAIASTTVYLMEVIEWCFPYGREMRIGVGARQRKLLPVQRFHFEALQVRMSFRGVFQESWWREVSMMHRHGRLLCLAGWRSLLGCWVPGRYDKVRCLFDSYTRYLLSYLYYLLCSILCDVQRATRNPARSRHHKHGRYVRRII